jgi:hypothetical protein
VALLVVELRRVLQVGLQVRGAAVLRDLGQVRRVVGAFAEQRVAVDAVVLVPDILAMRDGRRDVLCVRQFGELPVAVDGQPQEGQLQPRRGADREESGLSLVHGVIAASDADAGPVGDGDVAGVGDAGQHQHEHDMAENP